MSNFGDFRGAFGDFETFAHDVELSKYVFCIYGPDGDIEMYKIVVGWTVLPYDILLHVVEVEGTESNFDLDDHLEKNGVQLVLLRDFIGKFGVEIHPDFQLGAEPPGALDTQYDKKE